MSFQVVSVENIKMTAFLDTEQCSLGEDWRFKGVYCLSLLCLKRRSTSMKLYGANDPQICHICISRRWLIMQEISYEIQI
jgi:hypothetical protein